MSATIPDVAAEIKAGRDRKLAIVLGDARPAWVVGEQVSPSKNECMFEVVFRCGGRWVQRRYNYDAEVDVLYFSGEMPFDETRLHTLPDDALFSRPASE